MKNVKLTRDYVDYWSIAKEFVDSDVKVTKWGAFFRSKGTLSKGEVFTIQTLADLYIDLENGKGAEEWIEDYKGTTAYRIAKSLRVL